MPSKGNRKVETSSPFVYSHIFSIILLFGIFSPDAVAQYEYLDSPKSSKASKQLPDIDEPKNNTNLDESKRAIEDIKDRTFNTLYRHFIRPPGWEIEVGGTLLKPVEADFDNRADLGIGLVAGVRKGFFDGLMVLSHTFEYDVYFSGVNRLSLGGLLHSPLVRLEAYGGIKYKLINLNPFDNFISENEQLSSSIPLVGLDISLPGIRNYMTGRIEYWPTGKRFLLIGILVKLSI